MAIKSCEVNKYFIENYVLDGMIAIPNWTEEYFTEVTKGHAVIGFLFSTKPGKFGLKVRTLNLYLINRKYYRKSEVTLSELVKAWVEFEEKCIKYPDLKDHNKRNVFKNPPIEEYFKTKDNWIRKIAKTISEHNFCSYDEAICEINYTICKLYNKPHVYMGNLSYVQTAIWNDLRMVHRHEKIRITLHNKNVVSLYGVIAHNKEGNELTIDDIVGVEDKEHAERDFKEFEEECRNLMRSSFSDRELDQIFEQKAGYLPMNLYRRLIKWRNKNMDKLKKLKELI